MARFWITIKRAIICGGWGHKPSSIIPKYCVRCGEQIPQERI